MKDRTLVILIILEIFVTVATVVNDLERQKYINEKIQESQTYNMDNKYILLFPEEEETILNNNDDSKTYMSCIDLYRKILKEFYGYEVKYDDSYITTMYMQKQQELL